MDSKNKCYNRIVDKAKKLKLFKYNCLEFSSLDSNKQSYIKQYISKKDMPVLVFWGNYNEWTLLCMDVVITYYNNKIYRVNLSIAKRDFTPCLDRQYIKQEVITIDKLQKIISNDGKPLSNLNIEQEKAYKLKTKAKWLYAKNTQDFIWMPSNIEVYGVWSILIMIYNLDVCK